MALPQQAIDRLMKASPETPGIYQNLLLLSGALFLVAFFVYLGLALGYVPYLDNQIEAADNEIQAFDAQVSKAEQAELKRFYSQLVNVRSLLRKHVAITPVLTLLERISLPQLHFTRAGINVSTLELSLEGSSQNLDDVALQVSLFEKAPEVEKVTFRNSTKLQSNEWRFALSVFLKPAVLQGVTTGGAQ